MDTSDTPNVTPLAPTFKRAARIWWAWIWRSVLLGLGGSVFISLIVSISGIVNRTSDEVARAIAMVLAVIVSVPLGIWAFQMVLEKDFREFTIRLVARAQEGSALKHREPGSAHENGEGQAEGTGDAPPNKHRQLAPGVHGE